MSSVFILLQKAHDSVHDLNKNNPVNILKEKQYSDPKIYTGGVDTRLWSKLSKDEKKVALSKSWYVYYSFRNPKTGKLVRMPNIKGEANKLKNKRDRFNYLSTMRDALVFLLEKGFNPLTENNVETLLGNNETNNQTTEKLKTVTNQVELVEPSKTVENIETTSIKDAFEFALNIKKNTTRDVSYRNFKLRIDKFRKSLDENNPITHITKRVINDYLNGILLNTSARNRNNTRADLSSLFQVLEDNEIIKQNIVKNIPKLNSNPERNKTYTDDMQKEIYKYLKSNDPLLLLFIKFICYNYLRPIEVCELKIKDIDINGKKLFLRTKNKAVKVKIIPEILLEDLPDLSNYDPDHFLFSPTGYGQEWNTESNNKRNYFSKRFKSVVKDHFNLSKDYGMYSFRHTFITMLYREIRKNHSQFETKSKLMLITGHATMTALENYLRDIDAELPEDYSNMLRN